MNRLKNWCTEAVQKAISVLITKEQQHEEMPDKTIQFGTEPESTKNGHSSTILSSDNHLCIICNKPCVRCAALRGSSVDGKSYCSDVSEINPASELEVKVHTAEASTQTESLKPYLELTGLSEDTSSLPDLLVSSSSKQPLKDVALPPPPPPPPPPPLPPRLLSTNVTSTLNMTRKKQNTLKKSQSAGVSVGPEITVELLKNVKLRKMEPAEDMCQSNSEHSWKGLTAGMQPVVTLDVLKKVSLRKTQSINNADSKTPITKSKGKSFDDGPEDTIHVHNLRRTHMKRSPGESPQLKRRKQSAVEPHSVPCKLRRQSLAKSKPQHL